MKRRFAFLFFLGSLIATPSAFAAPGDAAAAEVLFKQARELATNNKFDEACPKFEESQKLDPGMGTLYNLADCYTHIGRHASAWAAFTEVADAAKQASQKDREDDARRRARDEEKLLSYISVKVAQPIDGLEITRDGVSVGKGQWGVRLPVDDGDHALKATAPKKKVWEKKVSVRGEVTVEVPALEDAPVVATRESSPAFSETRASSDNGSTQRIVGIGLIAGGGIAIVVGSIFGLNAMSKKDASNSKGGCSSATNDCADPSGPTLRDEGRTDGTLSTIFFIGGAALAGAGVVTVLTAGKQGEDRPKQAKSNLRPFFGKDAVGASLEGRF